MINLDLDLDLDHMINKLKMTKPKKYIAVPKHVLFPPKIAPMKHF